MPTPDPRFEQGGAAGLPSALDDHAHALFTVGQVSDLLGVQPAFLRRLDGEEMVHPARSDGGQRRYSRADIQQVQKVSALADEGVTLSGIRRILTLEAQVADLRRQLERAKAATRRARHRP